MTIEYDAPSNTITVTGYTLGTPCNFTDIYNEDVANSWGVVTKQCDNQFCFDCGLQIGDESTATWFADTDKEVQHTLNDNFIVIKLNAHFRIGEIVDAGDKTSRSGCKISTIASTGKNLIEIQYTGLFEAYSSILSTPNSAYFLTTNIDTQVNKIWNTIYSGLHPSVSGNTPNIELNRINIESSKYCFATFGECYDVRVTDSLYGFLFYSLLADLSVKNITIINETTSFAVIYVGKTVNLINVISDLWTFYWYSSSAATVNRQYEFDLKVIDKDGNSIDGATVKIWDKDSNMIVDTTTTGGVIVTQTISRGYYNQANGDTLQEYSPHLIKIEKAGYTTYEADFTLEEKTDWLIALQTGGGGGGLMRNPPMTGGMV